MRRVAKPLAITSLPVTTIKRTEFPSILRDFSSSAAFPDFQAHTNLRYEIVKPDLDRSNYFGLPVFNRTVETLNSVAGNTSFNQWYRRKNSISQPLSAISTSLTPDNSGSFLYAYGINESDFWPHQNDVGERWLFTVEQHLKLSYTATTALYTRSDDDMWVFVNGKLIIDNGGVHSPTTVYMEAADWKTAAGITSSTGVCDIAIFYAERYSGQSAFHFLSTDTLLPIYTYQLQAESTEDTPLHYSLVSAPSWMEIDPDSGKIIWDNYGRSITSGTYNVVVKVEDNQAHEDTQSFIITITP
jgi:fibro-slime domain-containing protein